MLLIQLKRSRRGTAIVVVDPGGDVHPCTGPEELWEAANMLLDEGFDESQEVRGQQGLVPVKGGRRQSQAIEPEIVEEGPRRRSGPQRVRVEEIPNEDEADGIDPFTAAAVGFLGQHGAAIANNAVSAMRGMSHRGPEPKPRRRKKR